MIGTFRQNDPLRLARPGAFDDPQMSSFDKVVKAACKPKAAPPKPKVCLTAQSSLAQVLATESEPHCSFQYLDALIAATYSEDGSVHDVCKALAPKFKEPNAIVSVDRRDRVRYPTLLGRLHIIPHFTRLFSRLYSLSTLSSAMAQQTTSLHTFPTAISSSSGTLLLPTGKVRHCYPDPRRQRD